MHFTKPWIAFPSGDGETRVPVLRIYLPVADGRSTPEIFVVDSGADVSMGPKRLCQLMGLDWSAGSPVQLRGISPREECMVAGMIHSVEIYVPEAARRITIPFCFADGEDAPLLLGREGFFDAFRVSLDKKQLLTTFEW